MSKRPIYYYEIVRLGSFRRWPKEHIVPGSALAADGFRYYGNRDQVDSDNTFTKEV